MTEKATSLAAELHEIKTNLENQLKKQDPLPIS
jgi:hypothetical protein